MISVTHGTGGRRSRDRRSTAAPTLRGLALVSRSVVDSGPVRVQYSLPRSGRALRPAITELTRWAEQNLQNDVSADEKGVAGR